MVQHDVITNGLSEQLIDHHQHQDCGRDVEQANHHGNKE
jgi:hypothetical protein